MSNLRHIGFSHFESDECGGLNHWLSVAPAAQPVCGLVGAIVSVNDFSNRPARVLTRDDVLATGRYRFRFLPTPHVPHGWDAGVLFEEAERTLFCSDLFHQWGHREPATEKDILERCQDALRENEAGPFATTCRIRITLGACWKVWRNGNRRPSPLCMARVFTATERKRLS